MSGDPTAVITAAGMSTRMGGFPKPLLHMESETFAERIVRVLAESGIEQPLIVLGHEAEIVQDRLSGIDATLEVNPNFASGMLSSVRIGVRYAKRQNARAMFLWPVDYPCVSSSVPKILAQALEASDADIVSPTYDGQRGHPVLFSSTVYEALLDAPDTEGARAVMYDDTTHVREVSVSTETILVDIDTPEEYWEAVKRYGLT